MSNNAYDEVCLKLMEIIEDLGEALNRIADGDYKHTAHAANIANAAMRNATEDLKELKGAIDDAASS